MTCAQGMFCESMGGGHCQHYHRCGRCCGCGMEFAPVETRYPTTEEFQAEHIRSLESDLAEERAIVNRIWEMFGNPAYDSLDGRSIYDFVQNGLDAISLLARYREGHRQPSGQECYLNIEEGDYRCPDCIEADRITGMQRVLNEMSAARISRLRESLAKPNNGL